MKAQLPVKRRKARRSKGMPKRPLSAYNFFFGQVRRMGDLDGDALGFAGLARAVAASWKSLDEDSKRPFYDMADQEQIRYKKACDEWRRSKRRCPTSPTKFEYVLQPRSPTPVDSQQRITSPTAHGSRMKIPQHTNCYSPETTHGYRVPGVISVATEVTNDSNDSLDLSPRHYGSYSPNGYDQFYDTNTYNTSTYNTNTYSTQSQRNGHPGHYGNFRNERTGPIHSTEQHGGYYSGPVKPSRIPMQPRSSQTKPTKTHDVARSGPVYSSDYYGNVHNNNDYGPAQHMWSSVPPTVASRRTSNPDYDAASRKRPCSPSIIPSVANMDSKSLADMEGEIYYDAATRKEPSAPSLATMDSKSIADMEGESDDDAPRKRPSSPSVPSLATVDSTLLADLEGGSDYDATPWKRPSSLSVPSLATVGSSISLADMGSSPYSINTKESSEHNILGKAESFEHMMDVMNVLEKEDNSCDVWTWLKDI
jgi:hypothetical protein